MFNPLIRIVLYPAVALLPLILAIFIAAEAPSLLQEAGKSFALLGFMILFLQVLLAARIKWIERAFRWKNTTGPSLLRRHKRTM